MCVYYLCTSRVEDIDSEWLGEHVKQVRAMLPGGMDIHGIFVVTNDNVLGNPKVKNKAFECCKVIQNVRNVDASIPFTFLQIDFKCQIVKAEALLTSDQNKTKLLSYEPGDLNWLCLKANLILDLPLAFTQEQTERPLSQKLETAVKRLGNSLENAVFLINGQYMEKAQHISPKTTVGVEKNSAKKKGKKNHQKEEITTTEPSEDEDGIHYSNGKKPKNIDVDILFDEDGSNDCLLADITAKMNIMGRMSVRAYVHERSNFEFAASAIKEDIIRTFKARMEMHYDSLVGEEMGGTDANLPILHEPPRRVNICLPDNSITVSDLLFPGETPEESVKAVEEMLGFSPQFEQLDDELEIVASPQTIKVTAMQILSSTLLCC